MSNIERALKNLYYAESLIGLLAQHETPRERRPRTPRYDADPAKKHRRKLAQASKRRNRN